nr:DUF748 domain-containing protein [uncultured Sulfurimonas sp.]
MFKKIQKTLLYFLLFYSLLGFVVLPLVLKSQLIELTKKETNATLFIDSIFFNPFIFSLKINDIQLKDINDKHLASLESIVVNLEAYSLLQATVNVKDIILQNPKITLIYNKDKSINFASIVKQKDEVIKQESSSDFEMPRVILSRVAIVNGGLNYEDYTNTTPFEFSFKRIGFELRNIDTKDFSSSDATLRFYTALGDGGFFDLKSNIVGLKPFAINGSVCFEASKLYTQWKYVQDGLNLEVADGKLAFNANYSLNLADLNSTSIDNASIYVDNLRVKPKNKHKDVLNLENFFVSGVSLKPMLQDVHIKNIALESLHLKVKRDSAKNLDWLEYIKTNFSQTDSTNEVEVKKETKAWSVLVDDIALENIKVDFIDEGVKPNVTTKLNDFDLYVKNLSLDAKEPFSYEMKLRANEEFVCTSNGDVNHKIVDAKTYVKCSGFDVVKFRPYIDEVARDALSVYDVKLHSANIGFDANISVLGENDEFALKLKDANFNLSKFALYKRSTNERLLDFKDFDINNLTLSTKDKSIDIEKSTLTKLNINTAMEKDAKLNIDNLIVVKKSKSSEDLKSKENKKEPQYRVKLKHFALASAKLNFKDKTLNPSLNTRVDRINFNAYNIDSKENSWLNYDVSARLNSKGYAKSKGKLRHTPLKNKSDFNLKKISLKEFSPYIEKDLHLKLNDGYIDLKTKVEYAKSDKTSDLKLNGNLDVKEFFLNDSRDNSTLISFNNMSLKDFDYEMSPDRAFVNELNIDGFYVNAIVNKNKSMNLSTLSKSKKVESKDAKTSKSVDANNSKFPFKIMKINVASGSAKFADYSLPLDFKTDIHDLNGAVYSVSNEDSQISYIDIAGEIDKYGSTKLLGSIDSSDPKLYTDLDFNFRNLDLNSMSGYSANFAGYKIAKGKLFLDLGYEILNSQMLGKNSIIVKQIELGDEIKDENITSLPLGFAIALLEDADGIIDINMPVEGNVDAPDFKYGALVFKTFANLIVKAVASPFKFLGSMMGLDGEKLEFVEFEAGSSVILPPEKEKLDNITKLLLKRPKITLKITPQYDNTQDGWILKQEKLILMVMKKSGIKNKAQQQNSMSIELLEDVYKNLASTKKLSEIRKKLSKTHKDEALEIAYQKELLRQTTQMQVVSQEELQALANQRASLLKEYLVDFKNIAIKRVVVQSAQNVQKDKENWVKTKLEVIVK